MNLIDRAYWVIPGKFAAGPFPGHRQSDVAGQRLSALYTSGIRAWINLMEPDEVNQLGEPFPPYTGLVNWLAQPGGEPVECLRFPIRDFGIPTPQQMRAILDAIDAALAAGRPVYLHCWGGIGRTGTTVGCYLARHGLARGQAALDYIAELRRDVRPYRRSPETPEQEQFVRAWSEPTFREDAHA